MSDVTDIVPVDGTFDLARTDGVTALKHAEAMIHYMADKCKGTQFISTIQGRKYPKVEWWTTVGAGLGLFPQEVSSVRLDREVITYEAIVEVRRAEQVISRASAICSASERTWAKRDEYAIKSMATTRATGKAYRIAFSFLAVMAGLEPTPAEEMPAEPEPQADPDAEFKKDDALFLRDMLLSYLEKVQDTVGKDRADKLRAAVVKNEATGQWKRFADWITGAHEALKAEVEKQENFLKANAKPETPLDKALGKLGETVGAKAGAAAQGELIDHD